jgi:hypothetical protein
MSTPPSTTPEATAPTVETVPPSTEPAPVMTVVNGTWVEPVDTCFYDPATGMGFTMQFAQPCNPDTWAGPVIIRTEAVVSTAPQTLPVTGSEGSVALVGGVSLLLGILFIRIARS